MSATAFAAPIKDVEAMKSFAKECNGARKEEYLAARKRQAVTKERIFLAQTPMGPMVMGYTEGLNSGFRMAERNASSNAFDRYEIESISKMAGIDISKVPASAPPHLVFEWTNGKAGKGSTMIAAPVPDPAKFWNLCRQMSARHADHSESRERSGMTLERAFYMHDAKMAVVYLEGDDPAAGMERSMASTAAYDKWFIAEISAVHGIDFSAHAPPRPELLVSYGA